MKILAVSRYNNIHTSRPEAEVFTGLVKMGLEVHFMLNERSPYKERLEEAGVKVVEWIPMEKFNKKESAKIRAYIIEHEIDILQLFNSEGIFNGLRAVKGLDTKVVLYRGFAGHIEWYNPVSYMKFLHPRVDAIWCNSIGVQQYVQRNKFFRKEKAVTINKGHDVAWYDYDPIDIRSELGISEDALLLVTAANNRPMKGVKYLLLGLNALPEDMDVHLILAGRDIDNEENLEIIESGNRKESVHFFGFRTDVLNLVASSDLFVLASTKGESITKGVLESMSLGVGAIISDIPGNVELVENGHNGLVFPSRSFQALAKAIEKVYQDRSLVTKFGKNSKKRIETVLSNKQTIEKVKALYESLMGLSS